MGKIKIDAAMNRIYRNVFICMNCNSKMKSDTLKVKKGKIKCRKCGYKGLRPKKKERKI